MIRVAVSVATADAEVARAAFIAIAPAGFEEIERHDRLELAVYVDDPAAVLALYPEAVTSEVACGWEESWRSFHRPVVVGGLWLGPPWETEPEGVGTVVIDPGRAFGTGSHPTTRLCVELLATGTRGSLLDLGCGSGVLAIAAARLGFVPIVAVDDDPIAVEVTRQNAAANGVVIAVEHRDVLSDPLPRTDVAVANVLLRPVSRILARLDCHEAITSGYLAGERPSHEGWRHIESLTRDGWAADRFLRETV